MGGRGDPAGPDSHPDPWPTSTPSPTPTPEPETYFCGVWPLSDVQNLGQTRIGPDDTLVTHYLVQNWETERFQYFIDDSGNTIMSSLGVLYDGVWHEAVTIFFDLGRRTSSPPPTCRRSSKESE